MPEAIALVDGAYFLACWKEFDPTGAKSRGLLSLMRRNRPNLSPNQSQCLSAYLRARPALESVYRFKQRLCYLLLEKPHNQKKCLQLAHRFLRDIAHLRCCGLAPLVVLGHTLYAWREEIATYGLSPGRITACFAARSEVISDICGQRDWVTNIPANAPQNNPPR